VSDQGDALMMIQREEAIGIHSQVNAVSREH
jgi:hypothetical protein